MPSRRQLLGKVIREVARAFTVDEIEVMAAELEAFVKARRQAEGGQLDADSLEAESLVDWL